MKLDQGHEPETEKGHGHHAERIRTGRLRWRWWRFVGIGEEPDATCRALHDGWQTLAKKPANQIIDLAA
jgi:hypothetical protein